MFPVSVSLRSYREGKLGNGPVVNIGQAKAAGLTVNQSLCPQLGQSGAEGGGFDAAEFSQFLDRSGAVETGQRLQDPLIR